MHRLKEQQVSEAEGEYATVNNQLQRAETTLSTLKTSLTSKKQEMAGMTPSWPSSMLFDSCEGLDKILKHNLDQHPTLDKAIDSAYEEVAIRSR